MAGGVVGSMAQSVLWEEGLGTATRTHDLPTDLSSYGDSGPHDCPQTAISLVKQHYTVGPAADGQPLCWGRPGLADIATT